MRSRSSSRLLRTFAALAIASYLLREPSRWSADSYQLYEGIRELLDWWRGGFEQPLGPVRPFPLFQYLTGLPVVYLAQQGVPLNVFAFWGFCSTASLLVMAWLTYRVTRAAVSAAAGLLATVVLLSGPLVTHAWVTDNELPAALLTLGFTLAATGRGGAGLCALLFFATAITKEIAWPMLTLIWALGLWMRRVDRVQATRHAVAMIVVAAAAVAANAAFNWLRYGSPFNVEYLSEFHLVRPWERRAQHAIALWLAPNGGVVWFWPTLLLFAGAAMLSGPITWDWRRALPLAGVALLLAALTIGLSGWYLPFGWWGWGPRLMLPWLPAALIILVRGYPERFGRLAIRLLARRWIFAATLAAACLLSIPHLLYLADPMPSVGFFSSEQPPFPDTAQADVDRHYETHVRLAWQKTPWLLIRPLLLVEPAKVWSAAVYVAAIGLLVWDARRQLSDRPPPL